MKIILRDEVKTLGTYGDVVTVADGYARNFLIPKGLCLPATSGNLKQLEAERDAWLKKALAIKEGAEKVKADLEAVKLEFTRKAGEEGKIFGSVTSMDIEAAMKVKGLEIDKKKITINEPLKSIGEFKVSLKLHPEVTAELNIAIAKEEQEQEQE
jgi:large subunit ribosomal protein L9